ncbi:uncharacterized protein LOC134813885 isoform X2 [Bolinopsis microptera]|uniref:uncharacterized protein LOC134813885 isoform X2 n=2 Tax=Bolinopsis microptera TaxID=2820187 RepID=UPI00307B095D
MMIMERGPECWSTSDVKSWAYDALGSDVAELFEREEINGECLSEISVEELKEMGVQKMGKRLLVIKKLKALMNNGQSGQSDSGVEAEGGSFSSPDCSPKPPSEKSLHPTTSSPSPRLSPPLTRTSSSPLHSASSPGKALLSSPASPLTHPLLPSSSPSSPPVQIKRSPISSPPLHLLTSSSSSLGLISANSPPAMSVMMNIASPPKPMIPTPLNPIISSPSNVIRAPIAHIPSHLDLYHVPKRMRLSPPSFAPTMLHSTVSSPINGSLEEALSKLNSYSDMARALSQHSLASSVRSLLGVAANPADNHQKILPGQVLKPIPQISSVTGCYRDNDSARDVSRDAASLSPVSAPSSTTLSDMMLDIKPSMINNVNSIFSKVRAAEQQEKISSTDHTPPTISVGDNIFQVNCRGKLTRESQERLKQVNPRLHSHYLTKRNLIKRACRTVFRDPPPFFYTDADRNSQEDLQVLEQLTEKLAPVCCIPELCFGIQGIRNHIIDSCRERRRECKRQSYRPSKARPAGHLYNSDGTHITDPDGQGGQKMDEANDLPYTLSQDSADCIIRVLFNVESVYHVRRSVHLIPITKRLGLSQRVDKNWMIMAIAQALLNNGYITFKAGVDLEHLGPSDFYLDVPDELTCTAEEIDVN